MNAPPGDLDRLLNEIDMTPIRMRGPLPSHTDQVAGLDDMSLRTVVGELRKALNGFPLTFIIHDWGIWPDKFVSTLARLIDYRDGLWLISGLLSEADLATAVVLDLKDELDKRLYGALVGDLVFFAGQETDVDRIETWVHRARIVIVDEKGPFFSETADRIQELNLVAYRQTSEGVLRAL